MFGRKEKKVLAEMLARQKALESFQTELEAANQLPANDERFLKLQKLHDDMALVLDSMDTKKHKAAKRAWNIAYIKSVALTSVGGTVLNILTGGVFVPVWIVGIMSTAVGMTAAIRAEEAERKNQDRINQNFMIGLEELTDEVTQGKKLLLEQHAHDLSQSPGVMKLIEHRPGLRNQFADAIVKQSQNKELPPAPKDTPRSKGFKL